jgi:hypothetical protein
MKEVNVFNEIDLRKVLSERIQKVRESSFEILSYPGRLFLATIVILIQLTSLHHNFKLQTFNQTL